jgi:hypothetical protein
VVASREGLRVQEVINNFNDHGFDSLLPTDCALADNRRWWEIKRGSWRKLVG